MLPMIPVFLYASCGALGSLRFEHKECTIGRFGVLSVEALHKSCVPREIRGFAQRKRECWQHANESSSVNTVTQVPCRILESDFMLET